MSLKDDLLEIQGVGDATADKILDTLEDHQTNGVDRALVETAYEYVEEDMSGYGEKFLRQALEE